MKVGSLSSLAIMGFAAACVGCGTEVAATAVAATAAAGPTPRPAYSDAQFVTGGVTPPAQAECASLGRRCFAPAAMQASYDMGPLYAAGLNGKGVTIAIVDSYGSETIRTDLNNFNTQFGLRHMCGEDGYTCQPGDPTFTILEVQGSPDPKAPPPTSHGAGLLDKNGWAIEVSLDVEWAHAIAPGANILLVTTPVAETLGVQGFPQMMKAEKYVVDNGLADVISQSFGAAEESFGSPASLLHLRDAFVAAQQAGVTVLAGTGDTGTVGFDKAPVGPPPASLTNNANAIPYPTVQWPASDPLVTAVGGTYLCTSTSSTTYDDLDSTSPPGICQVSPGVREVGWLDSGGGFSHVFARPSYQDTLPAGSYPIGTARGIPDVAFQASARTGVLIYVTSPPAGTNVADTGWFLIGGTSASTPQWAAIVAIADQANAEAKGHHAPLGLINPSLYAIASDPTSYANDFYDVTTGNNGFGAPTIPGYLATTGWDPVTGLGTPNAPNLVADLVALSPP